MVKKLLLIIVCIALSLPSHAIIWKYDSFNTTNKTCRLTGWSGTQPTSGKISIKSTYTHTDGVTYTVNSIAKNALNDLTEVTQITIPATVTRIGKVPYTGGLENKSNGVENFSNCPKLEKIIVDADNPNFLSTTHGILTSKDMYFLYRVPAACPIVGGEFNIYAKVVSITDGCFSGNNTIQTLTIPAALYEISGTPGFNEMTALKAYKVSENCTTFIVKDGALIRPSPNGLISYPPMRTIQNLDITYPIDYITEGAFANTKHLKTLKLPTSLRQIFPQAFKNSSIQTITLPEGLINIYKEAFYNSNLTEITFPSTYDYDYAFPNILAYCKNLTKITAKGKNIRFGNGFARNCTKLTTLSFETTPTLITDYTFKNCTSLKSFPFNTKTEFIGDSIFANTGFTTLKLPDGSYDMDFTTNMFAECSNLKTIDFSHFNTSKNILYIQNSFAGNCAKLSEILLPDNVFFRKGSKSWLPVFGPNIPLKKVVLSTFAAENTNVIKFSGTGTYTPKTFFKTTNAGKLLINEDEYVISRLYKGVEGATVNPVFYFESYKPPCEKYVDKNAKYYVPGGCLDNYSKAGKNTQGLFEMYSISSENADGKIKLRIKPAFGVVDITSVSFNDAVTAIPDNKGVVTTWMEYDKVKTVRVYYTVHGEEMQTVYPKKSLPPYASTNDITDNNSNLLITVNGRTMVLSGAIAIPSYMVLDINGMEVISGIGNTADLSSLAPGSYIVRAKDNARHSTLKILLQ